jgi:hypothetical protein
VAQQHVRIIPIDSTIHKGAREIFDKYGKRDVVMLLVVLMELLLPFYY